MIFVISGPSGCGKSTLVRHMLKEVKEVEFSVSHTTRQRRSSEKDGVDYYFVSEAEFRKLIKEDRFAEWAVVYGHYYGTSKRELELKGAGRDLLLDIDIQGATQIKEKFEGATFVFIVPPGFQELRNRLEKRGQEAPLVIQKRLGVAREEIKSYHHFDYIIVNDRLDRAVEELKSIILASSCRLDAKQKSIASILQSFEEGI